MSQVRVTLCLLLSCVPFVFTACKHTANQEGTSALNAAHGERRITLGSAESNLFMDALADSGVVDDSGRLGATTLTAARITCSRTVAPGARPVCRVASGAESLSAPADAARTFFGILEAEEAYGVDVGLGATVVEVIRVTCSRPVVPEPQASCVMDAMAEGGGDDGARSLSGIEADQLMNALAESGVTDTDFRLGARILRSRRILCSQGVVPNPTPRCQLAIQGVDYAATLNASKALFDILSVYGSRVEPATLGAVRYQAFDILCSRPVVPLPTTTCTFRANVTQ